MAMGGRGRFTAVAGNFEQAFGRPDVDDFLRGFRRHPDVFLSGEPMTTEVFHTELRNRCPDVCGISLRWVAEHSGIRRAKRYQSFVGFLVFGGVMVRLRSQASMRAVRSSAISA